MSQTKPRLTSHKVYDAPEGYVTLLQLRDWLNKQPEAALAAPALFSQLDEYGTETLLPVEIILDTWHPNGTPGTVHYNKNSEEYSRFVPDEFTEADERALGQLPPNCPLLHFDATEGNALAPRNEWLKRHLLQPAPPPPPAPAVAGRAPLFDSAHLTASQP